MNESILVLGERLTESNYVCVAAESNNLFTSSDQESTSGEDDVLGEEIRFFFQKRKLNLTSKFDSTDEEEIDKLNPNSVLSKAALAHNLPVMSQAIALGADKNWENPENLNRTPLHQSILVVSCPSLSDFYIYANPILSTGLSDDMRISNSEQCQSQPGRLKRIHSTASRHRARQHGARLSASKA